VALGGSATVDGGAGLRAALGDPPAKLTALCDVESPLLGPRGAARVFGPQKGASPEQVEELERRLAADPVLAPYADRAGAGAAGGLGAALAALGADLRRGIDFVLKALNLAGALEGVSLAVTGEGTVDRSSLEGKTVAGVLAACTKAGVPCAVFGGRVEAGIAEELHRSAAAGVYALSGDVARAREDLTELGAALAAR
jgi:glycerate 2-kinase